MMSVQFSLDGHDFSYLADIYLSRNSTILNFYRDPAAIFG